MHQTPPVLWRPQAADVRHSHLYRYMQWLCANPPKDLSVDLIDLIPGLPEAPETMRADTYDLLWNWSVQHPAAFWTSLWHYFEVMEHKPFQAALPDARMPGARWFEGASLNYAEHVFRKKSIDRPAILYFDERRPLTRLSWQSLEQQTAALAAFLKQQGVGVGDRVAAFLPNTPHAIVAVLATASIGAVWSSCSPDFGAASVADRFAQIEPKVLFTVDGYSYGGKAFDKRAVVQDICNRLPTIETVVFIPHLDEMARPDGIPNAVSWADALSTPAGPLTFEAVPFDHPLWVLYSSGTTGVPKAITHGHGGNLLEHLKYLHFHNDVHEGEHFFWYSTTGWMMWNFLLGSLLTGATAVLYDGSPGFPDLHVLWEVAAVAPIHHFGTSAPYLISCMKAGISPSDTYKLTHLRSIGSTGSPLPPEAYDWVYKHVKPGVWLSSMAGGTDVCTAWVGGNPLLPVYQGEIQCRCLGCAMESWDESGQPVMPDEVGEMVVTQPMPSMPIYFWNDPDHSKYGSSYFEHYPGVWRHGDWLRITPRGSLLILGRSDATLNRQGVRIGTAEIYRALDQIPDLRDSLIINLEYADGTDWMPLFVTLAPGAVLHDELVKTIKQTLRNTYSPRHVPDDIIEVPDIPYTISGKKMEMPVKKVLQQKPLDKAFNRDSMKNPESMDFFIALAEKLNSQA